MAARVNRKPLTANGKTRSASLVQPCRCLCRGSLQITRTTRFLRTILQLRQIFLTDASTFIYGSQLWAMGSQLTADSSQRLSFRAEDDPPAREIVRRQLHRDLVARQDPDVVHAHLARDVAEHD